jgi:hypothetical protein
MSSKASVPANTLPVASSRTITSPGPKGPVAGVAVETSTRSNQSKNLCARA